MKVNIALIFFMMLGIAISSKYQEPAHPPKNEDRIPADRNDACCLKEGTDVAFEVNTASYKIEPGNSESSHPLLPCLEMANEVYQRIVNNVEDYTCVMVKRERVSGRLRGRQYISVKVRHEQRIDDEVVTPFGVYMNFRAPEKVKGREVLYIRGHHDGKLLFRKGGTRLPFIGGYIDPTGIMAMGENRYPITEFGIKRLVERMIEMGEQDLKHDECEVEIRNNVELRSCDAPCTCIEVKHPIERPHFVYHLARVYIDNELGVPVRYESYDWPEGGSEIPVLQEEYCYCHLKLNVGLTDEDFECRNPEYRFRIPERVVTRPANNASE